MNVCLARKIDFFLGVPICFFLSFFERLRNLFFPKKGFDRTVKKALFLELSEIGSAILSYSAVEKFKKRYSDAEVYFWIFKENSEILYLLNSIPQNNIILMRNKSIFLLFIDALKNLRKIKKLKIDTVIDMELFSRFSSILAYLSGAKIRVGFHKDKKRAPYRGNLHTHKVIYNSGIHISKNFESLVDSIISSYGGKKSLLETGEESPDTARLPKIPIDTQEVKKLIKKMQNLNSSISRESKIVIMHIGFGDKIYIRRWPVTYYLELIQRVLEDKNIFVVVIGLGSAKGAEELFKYPRCLNLIGKTTIKELLALFSISKALISHDSGIVHVASLTNINIIVLFGPETPLLYKPLNSNSKILYSNLECSPCISAYNNRRSSCKDNKCLKMITVDQVYELLKDFIR